MTSITSAPSQETSISQALCERRSIRSFQDKPVAPALIKEILACARQAPSGGNIQPGFCHVLQGRALADLSTSMIDAANKQQFQPTYAYYPEPLNSPYKQRVMGAAKAMYSAAGIDRKDADARQRQQAQNYQFHRAPVGIVITIDKQLEAGSWVDLGAFVHAIMLAAYDKGLGSCAIGAIAPLHHVIAKQLALESGELTFCGLALGYADDAPVNQSRTSRLGVDEFSRFYGCD